MGGGGIGYEISGQTGRLRSWLTEQILDWLQYALTSFQDKHPVIHERLFWGDACCKNNVLAVQNTITGRRLKCDKRGSIKRWGPGWAQMFSMKRGPSLWRGNTLNVPLTKSKQPKVQIGARVKEQCSAIKGPFERRGIYGYGRFNPSENGPAYARRCRIHNGLHCDQDDTPFTRDRPRFGKLDSSGGRLRRWGDWCLGKTEIGVCFTEIQRLRGPIRFCHRVSISWWLHPYAGKRWNCSRAGDMAAQLQSACRILFQHYESQCGV